MRLPDRVGDVRCCSMMDDFEDVVTPESEAEPGSKIGVVAVFVAIFGIIVGVTGIILANQAQNEVKALEAKLAAKPDRASELQEKVESLDERLVKLGTEFVKLGRQDRQIQENTQAAFNGVSGNIQENRDGLNELGTKLSEIVDKLENWKPAARMAAVAAVSSDSSGESVASPPEEGVYLIQSGDTLSAIAKRFGVSLSALMATNPSVNPNRMRIGQKIIIPEL